MILRAFAAELLKVRKRPSTWALGLVWLSLILLFGYLIPYLLYRFVPAAPELNPSIFLTNTLPQALVANVVGFASLGGPLVLILAASSMGSEYGWGTLKTILTQAPGRVQVFGGKFLALGLVLLCFVVLAFILAGIGSLVVALIQGELIAWPTVGTILQGMGTLLLIFVAWAAFGSFLAVLFQNTALAVGLGLIYVLVIENLIGGFAGFATAIRSIYNLLLGPNAAALALAAAETTQTGALGQPPGTIGAVQALIATVVYCIVLTILAALLLRRRDVT